jgi:hypothetical protein
MTQLLGRDSVSVVVHSLRMDVSRGCAKMKPTAIFIAMYHFEKQSLRGGHPGCTGGVRWPLLGLPARRGKSPVNGESLVDENFTQALYEHNASTDAAIGGGGSIFRAHCTSVHSQCLVVHCAPNMQLN